MATLCGCGTSFSNPANAESHEEVCGEPRIDLGDIKKVNFKDAAVDYAYAVGYAQVDWRRRARAIIALNRR